MRVIHIISSIDLSKGGPPKSVSDLAHHQAKQGIKVTILTNKSSNPYIKESTHPRLKLIFVEGSFKKYLSKYLKTERVDLMHGHDLWQMPLHYMAQLGRKYNIPYIITPRGTLEPWPLSVKKWKKKLALYIYQRNDLEKAACIHATSQMELDNIRKLQFKNDIALISNGIDLKEFPKYMKKEKYEKKTILYLSRISRKKGIEILIEAWGRLEKSLRRNWIIEIAGNGDKNYIASLQSLIIKKGLAKEIMIIGPQFGKDKLEAYKGADLFVLPTYSENFGIVVAEALANEVPVITTNGTPWAKINTSKSGWYIDVGVTPLVKALNEAMKTTEDERNIMGINGRKLIKENYSVNSVAAKTIELYKWITENEEKPDFVD